MCFAFVMLIRRQISTLTDTIQLTSVPDTACVFVSVTNFVLRSFLSECPQMRLVIVLS
jgi:hypothetical protein